MLLWFPLLSDNPANCSLHASWMFFCDLSSKIWIWFTIILDSFPIISSFLLFNGFFSTFLWEECFSCHFFCLSVSKNIIWFFHILFCMYFFLWRCRSLQLLHFILLKYKFPRRHFTLPFCWLRKAMARRMEGMKSPLGGPLPSYLTPWFCSPLFQWQRVKPKF